MKAIFDSRIKNRSIRSIAVELGLSRNTVRKYLRAPGLPEPKARPKRPSKLEPYHAYLQERLAAGVDNGVVLLREIRELGYTGGYSILKDYVKPFRRVPRPKQTVRFETEIGEQAQVDFGQCKYTTPEGKVKSVWVFVMVLSWSRAIHVEFIERADTETFIRCHVNAFERFGGRPRQLLYDNTKIVVLDRDEGGSPVWNERFLDFALRVGFEIKLCHPYRPQTKGRVERGVSYVKRNFWPSVRFTDLAGINRQAHVWIESIANVRIHGTTHARPADRLAEEQPHLQHLPAPERLAPFLRMKRKVAWDGFVQFEKAWYGVPCEFAGQAVEVEATPDKVMLWQDQRRLAVHPRAMRPGQRSIAPHQWEGLTAPNQRPRPEPMAVQLATVEVQRRPLAAYDQLLEAVSVR